MDNRGIINTNIFAIKKIEKIVIKGGILDDYRNTNFRGF